MKKSIRKVTYKLYPTALQQQSLEALFVHHHHLYNWALRDRIETYQHFEYGLSFSEQCKIHTLWRSRRAAHHLFNSNAQSEQVTIKRVDRAFEGFFRRLKQGDRKPGFPRFKAFDRFKGWGYKSHGDGWKLHLNPQKHGAAYLADVGIVKLRGRARNEGGNPKTAEVILKNGTWYLSVAHEYTEITRVSGQQQLGLDWGVTHYFSVINKQGEFYQIDNPRYLKNSLLLLATLQRDLALANKGSRAYRKLKHRIALLHQKVARQRLDFTHKETTKLVAQAALLATEQLNITGMTRSATGTVDRPGKMTRQKSGLNREILNTAPGMSLSFLKYKAEEAGIDFVEIPTRKVKPSQTCPDCGVQKKKTLSERWHSCPCGCEQPRDIASARVNLNWALASLTPVSCAGNPPNNTSNVCC